MFDAAAHAIQGGRGYMEDFVRLEPRFRGRGDALYAAVFDGHGGDAVARRAAARMHAILTLEMEREPAEAALARSFRAFDAEIVNETSGAAAVVAVLGGQTLTVANVGDCHAVLVSGDRATRLTTEHRLENEEEFRRVVAAGARIWGPYACLEDGSGLMVTRALGDRPFRTIGIVCDPAVAARTLGSDDRWVLLGSDGIWDGITPEEGAKLVRDAATAEEAARRLVEVAAPRTGDNTSAIAVRIEAPTV
ncbi:MAG: protein phosphatase 2C family protein [Euryarchaeota archaeon]|nr:protein phosphatase 2C family protein [Euryarchaeota archaeon]